MLFVMKHICKFSLEAAGHFCEEWVTVSLLHATEIFGIDNICSFEQMFYQKISRWLPLSLCVSTQCNIIYLQIKRPNNMIWELAID